jgi:hypothetical protein
MYDRVYVSMKESEKEYCSKITYLCIPREDQFKLLTGKILDVDIYILPDEDSIDYPILTARLDWQDGLHIWQSECIDPFTWSTVANQLLLAMKEAKELIDKETYCAGDPE